MSFLCLSFYLFIYKENQWILIPPCLVVISIACAEDTNLDAPFEFVFDAPNLRSECISCNWCDTDILTLTFFADTSSQTTWVWWPSVSCTVITGEGRGSLNRSSPRPWSGGMVEAALWSSSWPGSLGKFAQSKALGMQPRSMCLVVQPSEPLFGWRWGTCWGCLHAVGRLCSALCPARGSGRSFWDSGRGRCSVSSRVWYRLSRPRCCRWSETSGSNAINVSFPMMRSLYYVRINKVLCFR